MKDRRKDKASRQNGFHAVLISAYILFFSINVYAAEPVMETTKLEAGLRLGVKFEFNSFSLTPESLEYLDKLAKRLTSPQWADERFIIEGHTDTVGKESVNLKFSVKRAEAVKSYLVEKHKIDPDRIVAIGYGESTPLDKSRTVKANIINRRVIMRRIHDEKSSGAGVENYIIIALLLTVSGLLGIKLSRTIFNRI